MTEIALSRSAGILPAPGPGTWRSRGYLRHFDQPGAVQFVTFRLADALPQTVARRLSDEPGIKPAEQAMRIEAYLDAGHGECVLRNPAVARDERQLRAAMEYIHNNPCAAGLADAPDKWQFSSAWRLAEEAGRMPALRVNGSSHENARY